MEAARIADKETKARVYFWWSRVTHDSLFEYEYKQVVGYVWIKIR